MPVKQLLVVRKKIFPREKSMKIRIYYNLGGTDISYYSTNKNTPTILDNTTLDS